MLLLGFYLSLALGFSFICSIAEAVLLSISPSYIGLVKERGNEKLAKLLMDLKDDVNTPLAAILTLNTIAHTVGAAGTGAQAAAVFGDQFVGIISGVLTLLILVFSEIIPKTLGAHYWRELAPLTARILKPMIIIFYPFVLLSNKLTSRMSHGPSLRGFNRQEFAAMADMSSEEGQIAEQEKVIIQNLLRFKDIPIREITTPRPVVFRISKTMAVSAYFEKHENERFSRIPVYGDNPEDIVGFVLRSDLLIARARGDDEETVAGLIREINAVPEYLNLSKSFEQFLSKREQIVAVIDEHGGFEGIVTLEDLIEFLLGTDIVDESDRAPNMRKLAKLKWNRKQSERAD